MTKYLNVAVIAPFEPSLISFDIYDRNTLSKCWYESKSA